MNRTTSTLAGRYELLAVLGRGGMGTVYRGRDRVLERDVAIKLLPDAMADDTRAVTRFAREARAAAALNHPGVVATYDTGVDGETRFIVMECVAGESLAAVLLREGALDVTRATSIAAAVAAALAAAHARGIVHRDIKPSNVMITPRDEVKVLDFGIARALDDATLTHSATLMGTAAYVSPEQGRGAPADERSDCYSLGCLLYEMLTGRPPFTGDAVAAVVHQHLAAEPQPPSRRRPGIPLEVDALVLGLLAKDPAARPGPAREVHRALAALPAPAPTAAARVTAASARPWRVGDIAGGRPAPAPPRPAATRRLVPREAPSGDAPHRSRRRLAAVLALAAVVTVLAAVVALTRESRSPSRSAAAAHRPITAHRRTAAPRRAQAAPAVNHSSSTTSTAASATSTTPAPRPAAPAPAPAAAAAQAVDRLLLQDAANGLLAPAAARQLAAAVADLAAQNGAVAPVGSLTDLARRVGRLERRGAVAPAAVAPLNAALAALAGAIGAGGAAEGAPATPPPAPGGDRGGRRGRGRDHGGGGGGD